MTAFKPADRHTFKVRVRLPDGRRRNCTCGTASAQTAAAITRFVRRLKDDRRWDILEAIVDGRVTLPKAYDLRDRLEELVASLNDRDLEPFVDRWYGEKVKATRGAGSADRYRHQVRLLIPAGQRFPVSKFTRGAIDKHLRALPVKDQTRNRHKAAFTSFAKYLVREEVLGANPVREIEGWSEGKGRIQYYERADAQRLLKALPQPYQALEALMVGAGLEWSAIERLRTQDVDLQQLTVYANGGKNPWRQRVCRIVEAWTVAHVKPALTGKLPAALVFAGVTNRRALEAHEDAVTACGLPSSTLHDWRHTHAVLMLRAGYKPTTVAHQLGHSSTALVWERYGRFVVDERDYRLPMEPPAFKEDVK